jgi:hypothetical protein
MFLVRADALCTHLIIAAAVSPDVAQLPLSGCPNALYNQPPLQRFNLLVLINSSESKIDST